MFMNKFSHFDFTLGWMCLILFWLRLISTIEVGQTSPVCTWTNEFLARVKVVYIRLNMAFHLDALQLKIERIKNIFSVSDSHLLNHLTAGVVFV